VYLDEETSRSTGNMSLVAVDMENASSSKFGKWDGNVVMCDQ
jgi:hypothetical protein